MNAASKLVAEVPAEVAADLEAAGLADPLPMLRSGGPVAADLLITGAQIATTLITILQVPETLSYLSGALSEWRRPRGRGRSP